MFKLQIPATRQSALWFAGVGHNGSMIPSTSEITHVSDTALMVAACRAHETELEDAYIRDPFAARLAGERGVAILNALSPANARVLRFGMAIRTRFVEELLMEALRSEERRVGKEC